MARPLRIEYPDAVYHVSNRGLDKQRVFPSAKYYEAFLEGLGETCSRSKCRSTCLLPAKGRLSSGGEDARGKPKQIHASD